MNLSSRQHGHCHAGKVTVIEPLLKTTVQAYATAGEDRALRIWSEGALGVCLNVFYMDSAITCCSHLELESGIFRLAVGCFDGRLALLDCEPPDHLPIDAAQGSTADELLTLESKARLAANVYVIGVVDVAIFVWTLFFFPFPFISLSKSETISSTALRKLQPWELGFARWGKNQ